MARGRARAPWAFARPSRGRGSEGWRRAATIAIWLSTSSIIGLPGLVSAEFPHVDRPVAPIITSAYSAEALRDERREAETVLNRLGIRPGVRVADVGAGDGYYTVRLAKRLGPGARIYAEDVEKSYLDQLGARLAREGIAGVTLIHGSAANPKLPDKSVDVAILAHVYHEVAEPYELLYRLQAALAPGGRVAIIDNDKATQDHGTPPALLRCELAAVGYRQIDFLVLTPADGYLAVFAPPSVAPTPADIRPCRH